MRTPDEWKGRPRLRIRARHMRTVDFARDTRDLAVPRFQRGYVWTPSDVLALCDSIMRGIPIGTVLLWYPESGGFWEHGRGIVVDGQQRISTLRGALMPGAPSGDVPRAVYDLDAHDFTILDGELAARQITVADIVDDEWDRLYAIYRNIRDTCPPTVAIPPDDAAARHAAIWREMFPARKVPGGFKRRPNGLPECDWMAYCRRCGESDRARRESDDALRATDPNERAADELHSRLALVRDAFRNHEVATISILGGALDDVREVFRRINTAGRPLDEAGINALLESAT